MDPGIHSKRVPANNATVGPDLPKRGIAMPFALFLQIPRTSKVNFDLFILFLMATFLCSHEKQMWLFEPA